MPSGGGPRFEVRFDQHALAEDLVHASSAGRRVLDRAGRELERDGLPAERLLRCQAEARDGTRLGGCLKTRLPWPDGQWGIVLVPVAEPTGQIALRAITFGERHPTAPWRPSVYQVAHRRLHGA
jgi:hypothetical protein